METGREGQVPCAAHFEVCGPAGLEGDGLRVEGRDLWVEEPRQ